MTGYLEIGNNGGINTKLTDILASRLGTIIKSELADTLVGLCQVYIDNKNQAKTPSLNTKSECHNHIPSSDN